MCLGEVYLSSLREGSWVVEGKGFLNDTETLAARIQMVELLQTEMATRQAFWVSRRSNIISSDQSFNQHRAQLLGSPSRTVQIIAHFSARISQIITHFHARITPASPDSSSSPEPSK